MNYLKNALINRKVGVRAKIGPKSGLKEPKIVEFSILKVLLPWITALWKAKSLSDSLGVRDCMESFFNK